MPIACPEQRNDLSKLSTVSFPTTFSGAQHQPRGFRVPADEFGAGNLNNIMWILQNVPNGSTNALQVVLKGRKPI